MLKLNTISDNLGAKHNTKRLGRGLGSGKGKTAGKGTKGQKARTGVSINAFEGGQMPLHRRLPKRGFTSLNKQQVQIVNFIDINRAIARGGLNINDITVESLLEVGLIRNTLIPVKLLAKGKLENAIKITVNAASTNAIEIVNKAGGNVAIV
jgi:large subunit ribosomal protein L15